MTEAVDGQADPRLEVSRAMGAGQKSLVSRAVGAGQKSLGQWGQDRSL